jgi:hypothetical protein
VHADPALEARLPVVIDGTVLTRTSTTAADYLTDANTAAVNAFLTAIGRSAVEVSVARAVDRSGRLDAAVTAFRAAGIDADALANGVLKLIPGEPTVSSMVLGGKPIVKAELAGLPTQYIYVDGDTAFVITAFDESLASAFVQAIS